MLSLAIHRLILPVVAMTLVVVASNILVQYPFEPFGLGDYLTWGAFTYPVAFLVTDLTNRRYGPRVARQLVIVGFALAVVLSIWLATPRIAMASGTAFRSALSKSPKSPLRYVQMPYVVRANALSGTCTRTKWYVPTH